MKPSALRIERLLAKVEAEHNARARPCRYVVYEDEYDEAIVSERLAPAPLLHPYAQSFEPRGMDREVQPEAGCRVQVINDHPGGASSDTGAATSKSWIVRRERRRRGMAKDER
jgi:hypothetical protein